MNLKLEYMPLFVFDIDTDRDCRSMSDAEFGRYMRLLIRQWIEGDVPAASADAVRDARLDPGSEDSVRSLLDRKFAHRQGNTRRNARLATERERAIDKVKKWRTNGAMGGRPKRENQVVNQLDTQLVSRRVNSFSGSDSEPSGSDLPEGLKTPEFQRAWSEWQQHRREKRQKLTPTATKRQLKALEAMGHDRAIAAIEHSIANGWTGIFEPDRRGGKSGRTRKPDGTKPGEFPQPPSEARRL